jgi:hypothetical protein
MVRLFFKSAENVKRASSLSGSSFHFGLIFNQVCKCWIVSGYYWIETTSTRERDAHHQGTGNPAFIRDNKLPEIPL